MALLLLVWFLVAQTVSKAQAAGAYPCDTIGGWNVYEDNGLCLLSLTDKFDQAKPVISWHPNDQDTASGMVPRERVDLNRIEVRTGWAFARDEKYIGLGVGSRNDGCFHTRVNPDMRRYFRASERVRPGVGSNVYFFGLDGGNGAFRNWKTA